MVKGDLSRRYWMKPAIRSISLCGVWPWLVDSCCLVFIEPDFFRCVSYSLGEGHTSGSCINFFKPLGYYSVNYFLVIKDTAIQKHNVPRKGELISLPAFSSCLFLITEEIGGKYVGIRQWQSVLVSSKNLQYSLPKAHEFFTLENKD